MDERSEIAGGILVAFASSFGDRTAVFANATGHLGDALNRSSVWQGGDLPPNLPGQGAYGHYVPRWQAPGSLSSDERAALDAAWLASFRALDPGRAAYLRLRVDSADDAAQLLRIGTVDSLVIAPLIERPDRPPDYGWQWPLRVGIAPEPSIRGQLAAFRDSALHERLYTASLAEPGRHYDLLFVTDDTPASAIAEVTAGCLVRITDRPAASIERRDGPFPTMIDVAIDEMPGFWWPRLLYELAHDVPLDAALAAVVREFNIAAFIAGPPYGLDITAAAHWFAAVAVYHTELAPLLEEYTQWDWRHETGGASTMVDKVRGAAVTAGDIVAPLFPLFGRGAGPPEDEASSDDFESSDAFDAEFVGAEPAGAADPSAAFEVAIGSMDDFSATLGDNIEEAAIDTDAVVAVVEPTAPQPRRLVARVFDGDKTIRSVLPPKRELNLAVRIAIPEADDIAADRAAPALPSTPGPTVELEVVVRSDVWDKTPPPQKISISREQVRQPSSWAVFPFTTPDNGGVVSVEIVLLYQGKPLQAATFVAPVRTVAVPGERPTLTTFALSGPDEPTDDLQPVDVTLDARFNELERVNDGGAKVLISGVQDMLDRIEDRLSRVLGVPDAPSTLDDKRAVELLVTLARIGVELRTMLEPLDLGDARSINLLVNHDTRVMPLELVYDGPAPNPKRAKLCRHADQPPPPGERCDRASTAVVCPYAFWGLTRSIARTVSGQSKSRVQHGMPHVLKGLSTLYAATVIADDDAKEPLPSAAVLKAAEAVFPPVRRVTSWTAWRKAVKEFRPNLLVVLGHTMMEGGELNLYIGKHSALSRVDITDKVLRVADSPPPLVLLIACASAALGDPFGTLPGKLTASGAGAVVGTLSKITGPQGADATAHLLRAFRDAAAEQASVGTALTSARRSLLADKRPIGLVLVSHGEVDTKVLE